MKKEEIQENGITFFDFQKKLKLANLKELSDSFIKNYITAIRINGFEVDLLDSKNKTYLNSLAEAYKAGYLEALGE